MNEIIYDFTTPKYELRRIFKINYNSNPWRTRAVVFMNFMLIAITATEIYESRFPTLGLFMLICNAVLILGNYFSLRKQFYLAKLDNKAKSVIYVGYDRSDYSPKYYIEVDFKDGNKIADKINARREIQARKLRERTTERS